jgi:hypothetical protein
MKFDKNFSYIPDREGRAQFIADTFKVEIRKSKKILDVGSDYNSLKKIVGKKVLGVDLYGEPDIKIDFEKEKLERFKNSQFDLVVCTEVLEHLDNLHEMVDELFRVSNQFVIISLPNCLSVFTKWNIVFHTRIGKYYGLPFEEPEDRHRWLFSYLDIDRFFSHYCSKNGYRIRQEFLQCSYTDSWRGKQTRILVQTFNVNSACQSIWLLIEKKRQSSNENKK